MNGGGTKINDGTKMNALQARTRGGGNMRTEAQVYQVMRILLLILILPILLILLLITILLLTLLLLLLLECCCYYCYKSTACAAQSWLVLKLKDETCS